MLVFCMQMMYVLIASNNEQDLQRIVDSIIGFISEYGM